MPDKPLGASVADIKEDLKLFLQTRLELLRVESKEKLRSWKRHLVLLALAAVFLVTCWITLIFALVALLHTWISQGTYAWFWGGLIVGLALLVTGLLCARSGYRGIKSSGVMPSRTWKVLRQDQEWIQRQARPA